MATMASNGPLSARRQASARASRWNWSQDTGNDLRGACGIGHSPGLQRGSGARRRSVLPLAVARLAREGAFGLAVADLGSAARAPGLMRRLDALAAVAEVPGQLTRRYLRPAQLATMTEVAGCMRGPP